LKLSPGWHTVLLGKPAAVQVAAAAKGESVR